MPKIFHIVSIILALVAGLVRAEPVTAQYTPGESAIAKSGIVVGERMDFRVRLGRLRLGHATLAVEAMDEVAGVSAHRAALDISIGASLLGYEDRMVSWIAPEPLRSLAFEQRDEDTDTGRRRYEFDEDALDEVAALYMMRTLPLNEGDFYTFDRYFTAAGNPITFRVLRRERVRVPAGSFDTIVVEPVIRTLFVFKPEAHARIYVTDDDRRIVVQMEAVTRIGKLIFYLTDYDEGTHPSG